MTYYARIQEGVVAEVIAPFLNDEGTEVPIEDRFPAEVVATLVPCTEEVVGGMTYNGTTFSPFVMPPPTPEQILTTNSAIRDAALSVASAAIAPLQDAVDLDEATDAETILLKQWKQYRVAVNRVDLTLASPTWPVAPA